MSAHTRINCKSYCANGRCAHPSMPPPVGWLARFLGITKPLCVFHEWRNPNEPMRNIECALQERFPRPSAPAPIMRKAA